MDGNFVAKSSLKVSSSHFYWLLKLRLPSPAINHQHVSPQEDFSCSLGVDASIKVTYDPAQKKAKTTGAWTGAKVDTTIFTQRCTIKNTRQTPLRRLTLKDQVPVSEDNTIKVTVLEPSSLTTAIKGTLKDLKDVVVPKGGVSVRWVQKNEEGAGGGADDGIVEWVYEEMKAGATVSTVLSWEVSAPSGVQWA